MSRYVCSYTVPAAPAQIQYDLREILQQCNCEVIYNTNDYLMAKEVSKKVRFSKLVTVEVLIDSTTATAAGIQTNLVVKNEELPLKINNHCHQLFKLVQQKIANDYQWQLLKKQQRSPD